MRVIGGILVGMLIVLVAVLLVPKVATRVLMAGIGATPYVAILTIQEKGRGYVVSCDVVPGSPRAIWSFPADVVDEMFRVGGSLGGAACVDSYGRGFQFDVRFNQRP